MSVQFVRASLPGCRRSFSSSNAFSCLTRDERIAFHGVLRTAEVAEALRNGFKDGLHVCYTTSSKLEGHELKALQRATRTRPSLLTPMASAFGIVLRRLSGLPGQAGNGTVNRGVLVPLGESLESNVRQLIELERVGGTSVHAAAAEVKEFMKRKRDSVERPGDVDNSGVLMQLTQLVCRGLLKSAERF